MTYQGKVEKALQREFKNDLFCSQWIRFADANGFGYAQPDYYLICKDKIICFEAKLTQNYLGLRQLLSLYSPLLSHIYSLPVVGVLVFKNITEDIDRRIEAPREVLSLSARSLTYYWHYVP